uniref:Uncharacterized protein n=1 Tax=Timspurckia oligopyrenoides TaxID=708627 RepID=A0A7S0ZJ02_9RHOD|mmetsp:Transcript_7189/g.12949  ORF Transcript_7189/g.12949 Transcript_7189/m.12949 type:complete len:148 (+) Transcript_7189:676-1119(+)
MKSCDENSEIEYERMMFLVIGIEVNCGREVTGFGIGMSEAFDGIENEFGALFTENEVVEKEVMMGLILDEFWKIIEINGFFDETVLKAYYKSWIHHRKRVKVRGNDAEKSTEEYAFIVGIDVDSGALKVELENEENNKAFGSNFELI